MVVNIKTLSTLFTWWRVAYITHEYSSGDVIAEKYRALTAAFSGANDLGAGGSACALSADALRGRGERRRGVISRQRRCAGERSVEARHIVPSCPTTRPVRKTCKSGCEIRTAMFHLPFLAVRSPLTLSELRTAKKGQIDHPRSRADLTWPSPPTR